MISLAVRSKHKVWKLLLSACLNAKSERRLVQNHLRSAGVEMPYNCELTVGDSRNICVFASPMSWTSQLVAVLLRYVVCQPPFTKSSRRRRSCTSMAASKRKRGGDGTSDKKGKKGKFVADKGETPPETEQETKNEVTVPAPVSMVSD